jgi:hypothetical protein
LSRYNLLIEGNADDFLKKIKGRRKSLIVNAILANAITNTNKKIEKVLENYFSKEEVSFLLNKDNQVNKDSPPQDIPKDEKIVVKTTNNETKQNGEFKVKI